MGGVIFLHYYNATMGKAITYVEQGSESELLLNLLETLNACAVDLFVIITGYFLSQTKKRTLGRAFSLLLQLSVYRVAYTLIKAVFSHSAVSARSLILAALPANWFVVLYCVLYVISPFLNRAWHDVRKGPVIWGTLVLFSLWPTAVDTLKSLTGAGLDTLSTIGMYGSQHGYTIVNFVMCYLIGAYIREFDLTKADGKKLLLLLLTDYVLNFFWSRWDFGTAFAYFNPLVILRAALIFMLFLKLDIGTRPAINELASCAFSVYILHYWLFPIFKIEQYVKSGFWVMTVHIFVTITAIILISYLVDKVYRLLFGKIDAGIRAWRPFEL